MDTSTSQTSFSEPLTVEQAAAYLGISRSYLYKLTSRRLIPHYKSRGGKRCYLRREDLDAWAFGRRIAAVIEEHRVTKAT